MASIRKFLGGVVSGGVVAGLTLVVASQVSTPRNGVVPEAAVSPPVVETVSGGVTNAQPAGPDAGQLNSGADSAPPDADAPAADVVVDGVVAPSGVAVATVTDAPEVDAPVVAEIAPVAGAEASAEAGAANAPAPASAELAGAEPASAEPAAAADPIIADLPAVPPAVPVTAAPAQSAPAASDRPPVATPVVIAEAAGSLTASPAVPPAQPVADGAPTGAELPPPPPLTPEEAAAIADPARIILPPDTEVVLVPEPAPEPEPEPEPVLPRTGAAEAPSVANAAEPETADVPVVSAEADLPLSPVIDAPDPAPVVVADAPPAQVSDAPVQDAPVIFAAEAEPETLSPDVGLVGNGPKTLPATPRLITAGEGALTDRDTPPVIAAEVPPADDAAALPEVALDAGPAIERFAAPFANPDGKPLFGILLVDTGDAALDRQAVAALPFAVSIVIDPLSPDAATHAALYRAGGKEVVMLATGIPPGATPADLEQTFQAHAAALPQAVAVIDASDSAFQNDRPLSSQIVPILAAQGRGLLTWDRGLNAADQVARREGLPTAMVFRQIDAEGEGVPVMRRYLDRAAFKAAQEGQAIVIGTLRAETIAALLEWSIEGRASTVAVAPASALLQAD